MKRSRANNIGVSTIIKPLNRTKGGIFQDLNNDGQLYTPNQLKKGSTLEVRISIVTKKLKKVGDMNRAAEVESNCGEEVEWMHGLREQGTGDMIKWKAMSRRECLNRNKTCRQDGYEWTMGEKPKGKK